SSGYVRSIFEVPKLLNLINGPDFVNGDLNVGFGGFKNFENFPQVVKGIVFANNCKLESFSGSLRECDHLNVDDNFIRDFYDIPKVNGSIVLKNNPISFIYEMCPTKEFIYELNENKVIRDKMYVSRTRLIESINNSVC